MENLDTPANGMKWRRWSILPGSQYFQLGRYTTADWQMRKTMQKASSPLLGPSHCNPNGNEEPALGYYMNTYVLLPGSQCHLAKACTPFLAQIHWGRPRFFRIELTKASKSQIYYSSPGCNLDGDAPKASSLESAILLDVHYLVPTSEVKSLLSIVSTTFLNLVLWFICTRLRREST